METSSEGERPATVQVLRLVHELMALTEIERALLLRIVQPKQTQAHAFLDLLENERIRCAAIGMSTLSPAERAVVDLYVSGLATGDIAIKRGTSKNTVANLRKRAMSKIGAESLVDLVRLAIQVKQRG